MTQPKYAAQNAAGQRYYKNPETGKRLPSVTTIIGAVNKPLLVPWAAKIAAQYAVENWQRLGRIPKYKRVFEIKKAPNVKRDDAGELGDSIHEYAEAYLKDQPLPPITDKNETGIGALFHWLDTYQPEMLGSEVSVWSEKHGYAGTFDLLAKLPKCPAEGCTKKGGCTWMIDYKTGKGVYAEVGMQLSALGHAETVLNDELDKMPHIDHYGVVHIRTEQPILDDYDQPVYDRDGAQIFVPAFAEFHEVHQIEECFEAFLAALKIYEWQKTEKLVVPSYQEFSKRAAERRKELIADAASE